MLSTRNEWIAIGVLLLLIAFVPCPYAMKEFFATPVGKLVGLGAVVYAWKYLSPIVAVLVLVAVLRSGTLREFLDESGLTPPAAPSPGSGEFKCPDEFTYVAERKMCMKGNESKSPDCDDKSMMWDSAIGSCINKTPSVPAAAATSVAVPPMASSGTGGPSGGTTPGAMAAQNELTNAMSSTSVPPPTVESFTPYGGKSTQDFAPL